MPAYARTELIDENTAGTYHCINRCVRRAFLCGDDQSQGQNYEYRKGWIKERIAELAKVFAIDIAHYTIMANHMHLLLSNRPDRAALWSDDEVIDRWWQLYPRKGLTALPEEVRKSWLADSEFIEKRRQRLASISWFMRCLSEPIARRANKEDKVTGRFWQGRFTSKKVLDEHASVETGIYIDLNPIKARVIEKIEDSSYTSLEERIAAVTKGCSLNFILPIRATMNQFANEAPFLLDDEKDYVELVRQRAQELNARNERACLHNSFIATCATAIGSASSLEIEARKRGRKWLKGLKIARKLQF